MISPGSPTVLDAENPDTMTMAIACLKQGGVICIPTDTVYGIAASLDSLPALERVYDIKGRDADKPLPVLIDAVSRLADLVLAVDRRGYALLETFWPGALTVILPARSGLPGPVLGSLTDATMTIGLRLPDNALAVSLAAGCGGGIAVTSANRSGCEPATTAALAIEFLGADVDLVIDAGEVTGGTPSTVIDLCGNEPVLLRRGSIDFDEIVGTWNMLNSAGPINRTQQREPRLWKVRSR